MRIGTAQSFSSQTAHMTRLQTSISDLQAKISVGKRILKPSDDPLGSQRVAHIADTSAAITQFRKNIDVATRRLSLSDSATDSMINQISRAREIALAANNATYSAGDRDVFASEIASIRDELFSLANTRDVDGNYMFSGGQVAAPAFVRSASGAVLWQGAGSTLSVPTDSGTTITAGIEGNTLLTVETGDTRQSVFTMMEKLEMLLRTDPIAPENQAAWNGDMEASLSALDQSVTHLTHKRAVFGTRLAQLDSAREAYDSKDLAFSIEQSSLESLDIASAITSLQSELLVLQATQESFVKIKSLSLFDSLR